MSWLVVWNMKHIFSIYWECHHPNWRTPSFFRGVGLNHQAAVDFLGEALQHIQDPNQTDWNQQPQFWSRLLFSKQACNVDPPNVVWMLVNINPMNTSSLFAFKKNIVIGVINQLSYRLGAPHCDIQRGDFYIVGLGYQEVFGTLWDHSLGVNRGTVDSMASFSKQLEHSSGDTLADIAHKIPSGKLT